MIQKHFKSFVLRQLYAALCLLLYAPVSTLAAGDMEEFLPPVSCGSGWKIEGKPVFYNRDTLSDRINGEAELYFPYGFDRMAAARYASAKSPGAGIDVEIYRLGSLLDAFGMYANYRQREGRSLGVGAESNLSGSQLFIYQERYFVHIQVTGSEDALPDTLADCARTVSTRIPGKNSRPQELSVFDRQEVAKGTERYLPQSLLGYDFLNKGIMAEAIIGGSTLQIFTLLGNTAESASAAFDSYRTLLKQAKRESGENGDYAVEGMDPLYGPVFVLKKGNCLAGALKFSVNKGVRALLENLCR